MAKEENSLALFSNLTNDSTTSSSSKNVGYKELEQHIASRPKAEADLQSLSELLCGSSLVLTGPNKDAWLLFIDNEDKKVLYCYWNASLTSLTLSLVEDPASRFAFALLKSGRVDVSNALLGQTELLHLGQSGNDNSQSISVLVETVLRQLALISDPDVEEKLRDAHAAIVGSGEQLLGKSIAHFYDAKCLEDLSKPAVTKVFEAMKTFEGFQLSEHYGDAFNKLSDVLCGKLLVMLDASRLMKLTNNQFETLAESARAVLFNWESEWTLMREWLLEKKISPPKVSNIAQRMHLQLVRCIQLRRDFDRFLKAVRLVFPPTPAFDPVQLLESAYLILSQFSPLELNKAGITSWHEALGTFEGAVDRIETQIANRLLVSASMDASTGVPSDLFAFFSTISPLLHRAKIRKTLLVHQQSVFESVSAALRNLSEESKNTNPKEHELFRHLPGVCARLAFAKQLDSKCNDLEKAVNDSLGPQWTKFPRGSELKLDIETFRSGLNPHTLFQQWETEMKSRDFKFAGSVLRVCKHENRAALKVNFDSDISEIYAEIKALEELGYHVSFELAMNAARGYAFQSAAKSLDEALSCYDDCLKKLTPELAVLFQGLKADIDSQIDRGLNLHWSSLAAVEPYISKIVTGVAEFSRDLEAGISSWEIISARLHNIQHCPELSASSLVVELKIIQSAIDLLGFAIAEDAIAFTSSVNLSVESILLNVLEKELRQFASVLESGSQTDSTLILKQEVIVSHWMLGLLHKVIIKDDTFELSPPLTGSTLYDRLNVLTSVPSSLGRLQIPKSAASHNSFIESNFNSVEELVDGRLVEGIRESIRSSVNSALAFADQWMAQFDYWQAAPTRFADLPSDLEIWRDEIQKLSKSKSALSDSSVTKSFGVIALEYTFLIPIQSSRSDVTSRYAQVKDFVKGKCDYWHSEMRSLFASKLAANMLEFSEKISALSQKLRVPLDESLPFDAAHTFSLVRKCNFDLKSSLELLALFESCEKELRLQMYQFPSSWLSYKMLSQTWVEFKVLLDSQDADSSKLLPRLQTLIAEKLTSHESRVRQLADDWTSDKPKATETNYVAALDLLNIFKSRVSRLIEENTQVTTAQKIVGVSMEGLNPLELLRSLGVEFQQQQRIWQQLSVTWITINDLRALPWTAVNSKRVRASLEELMQEIKKLPQDTQRYEPFIHCQRKLRFYLESNQVVTDLRSCSVRDRHWKELQRRLRVEWDIPALTLGHVWDTDIPKYKSVYAEVITACQGELALEEYLKQSSSYWNNLSFDFVPYQNKCKLIRGWDALFSKLGEDTTNLTHMKLSPFYKAFADQAVAWETRLSEASVLLNSWIEIQRRWVYLEGVFETSADIKQLLPRESTMFEESNNLFVKIMLDTEENPLVMDALSTPDLQHTFQRLSDVLTQIQKALGEYLERQRAAFPRFYFVGDEDLLDIVGSGQDPRKIQKHIKKMFVGVNELVLAEEGAVITGMISVDGEQVLFQRQILPKIFKRLDAYLGRIESEMRSTLAGLLQIALSSLHGMGMYQFEADSTSLWNLLESYPAQVVLLAAQVAWTSAVESAISKKQIQETTALIEKLLGLFTAKISSSINPIFRKKCEQLISELVHQRDVCRKLVKQGVENTADFGWLAEMRFYHDATISDSHKQVTVKMANATFEYGFEYLGVVDRLIQTPLTDRVFLTLTQALHNRMGGNPFGPAGTGKTETVKALSQQLGRHIVVFGCDEAFDYQAMSRILVGLSQCGAWGCFDEFNRLEERILSAVSQQIQLIQESLRANVAELTLTGKRFRLNPQTGIFVTLNPTYAGRSNLPDNLKQLFRGIAMFAPDRELIAEVMLFTQGFASAEMIARKIVPLFKLCTEQLSAQSHYDFGLRALKSVLVTAGVTRRQSVKTGQVESDYSSEVEIILKALAQTVTPTLVSEDLHLFAGLAKDIFQTSILSMTDAEELVKAATAVCSKKHLIPTQQFLEKVVQLFRVQSARHGVMLVGPSASGKTSVWRTLLDSLEVTTGKKTRVYVIDPKAISKEQLFGALDSTTREWRDGIFTSILRTVQSDQRGEKEKMHFIVFDGDVDPDWVENLNALLDDNKLLTLPSGERIALADSVRILFEVDSLRHATPATVSRCGMLWFSDDVLSAKIHCDTFLATLKDNPIFPSKSSPSSLQLQQKCVDIISPYFTENGFVFRALELAQGEESILVLPGFSRPAALNALFSQLRKSVGDLLELDPTGLSITTSTLSQFMTNRLVFSTLWGFGGGMALKERASFAAILSSLLEDNSQLPANILDYEVSLKHGGNWIPWSASVPKVTVDEALAGSPDVVVPTVDTARNAEIVRGWLKDRQPLLLCGPPGSGKTMTLTNTLKSLPEYIFHELSLSSASSPSMLLKSLSHHCEIVRGSNGDFVMRPKHSGKWLVFFLDELNLPAPDSYGTQRIITFLRQLIEHGGYWRPSDLSWVNLERVQFVGACNPPSDAGRNPLPSRYLRHAPVLYVDFPSSEALQQIFGTLSDALLRPYLSLRESGSQLTSAMIAVYSASQTRLTSDQHAHYVYSPRDLSRWLRAIHDSLKKKSDITERFLAQLWMHEGLRIFHDRLVDKVDREWTDELFNTTAQKFFPEVLASSFTRPLLFTDWLTHEYESAAREDVRTYIQGRIDRFNEEELDVSFVLFSEVIDHMLRIDRVLKQPQGHLLLIGASGSGKSLLSRFVAWQNGHAIFTIKVNGRYSSTDFDEDLKLVMRRCGVDNERISFIFDESNVLESSFLERMNALLSAGEIPGLFEGNELHNLLLAVKTSSQRRGMTVSSDEDAYKLFVSQVRQNLHIIFTMNPSSPDFHNRALTSPALFNRCTIDWFGDWSDSALYQVGAHFTKEIDFEENKSEAYEGPSITDSVLSALVFIHQSVESANSKLKKEQNLFNYVTPRHYLDFISHLNVMIASKREELTDQQSHLSVGLQKLQETATEVKSLQEVLAVKSAQLSEKKAAADEKLRILTTDKVSAEAKRKQATELQTRLEQQTIEIEQKKFKAQTELAVAKPALEEAKKAVTGIQKKYLDEIKGFKRPPQLVQETLEAVCFLLGAEKKLAWSKILQKFSERDFIPSIINFKTKSITDTVRQTVQAQYLSQSGFSFEAIDYASKACGPLYKWLHAHCNYSEIKNRVKPLKAKIVELTSEAEKTKVLLVDVTSELTKLEAEVAKLSEEHLILVAHCDSIQGELSIVETKVKRSNALLDNISKERERWDDVSNSFSVAMGNVVGNSILCSAFIAYCGFYDQHYRGQLLSSWKAYLRNLGLQFAPELSVVEHLSTPDERFQWRVNKLTADDIAEENAVVLNHYNRYPLVIDPSGQATEFLLAHFADRKLTKTSFLAPSFLKDLEAALRFGTALLVEDVESIDPILNPVLNREVRKTGGRVLIRVGDQDMDMSPSFALILSTRDPQAHFTPDLCSRVTFVNFTVTPASLRAQCLDHVVRFEEPELHKQRQDLKRLQSEYNRQLRRLEKALLLTLNKCSGKLLDSDEVLSSLEKLQRDAIDLKQKAKETDDIAATVTQLSHVYSPIATASSKIYFTLSSLPSIHFLYHFSLKFFLDLYFKVLEKISLSDSVKNLPKVDRVRAILNALFCAINKRVSRTLLQNAKLSFSLKLAELQLELTSTPMEASILDEIFALLPSEPLTEKLNAPLLTEEQRSNLLRLCSRSATLYPIFSNSIKNTAEWKSFLKNEDSPLPPSLLAQFQQHSLIPLAILRASFPVRFGSGALKYLADLFGSDFFPSEEKLSSVLLSESSATSPILMCSVAGFDQSHRIDEMASALNVKKYRSIALGTREAFDTAISAIDQAAQTGGWVLLKNVHLVPQWLTQLEKRIHGLSPHQDFRLFLTAEINPALPSSLLRSSDVFTFEAPHGIRANLLHSFAEIPQIRFERGPPVRSRLYFLVLWLHAVLQERLRYVPMGWTKQLEFTETDKRAGLDAVDVWLDKVVKDDGTANESDIPLKAISQLLQDSIYGNRIESAIDRSALSNLVGNLFRPEALKPGYLIASEGSLSVTLPSASTIDEYRAWLLELPVATPPSWLHLPSSASKQLLIDHMQTCIANWRALSSGTKAALPEEISSSLLSAKAAAEKILKHLPMLPLREPSVHDDPVKSFFSREFERGAKWLTMIRSVARDIIKVADGLLKPSAETRLVVADLSRGSFPKSWKLETFDTDVFEIFLMRAAQRAKVLSDIHTHLEADTIASYLAEGVNLSQLASPEAFLLATRQSASRSQSRSSLESVQLKAVPSIPKGHQGIILKDLRVHSSALSNGVLSDLTDGPSSIAPSVKFIWEDRSPLSKGSKTVSVSVPFYLNDRRQTLLAMVSVDVAKGSTLDSNCLTLGVALTAQ